jgi:hypothetical protein
MQALSIDTNGIMLGAFRPSRDMGMGGERGLLEEAIMGCF